MSHYLLSKPKSYTNPQDADLFRRLAIAFAMQPRDGWRDIQVIVRHGLVTLIGEVPTFRSRQLLVAVARHVAGVLRVSDELSVVELPTRRAQSSEENALGAAGPTRIDSNVGNGRNALNRVPASAPSLEDIVAGARP